MLHAFRTMGLRLSSHVAKLPYQPQGVTSMRVLMLILATLPIVASIACAPSPTPTAAPEPTATPAPTATPTPTATATPEFYYGTPTPWGESEKEIIDQVYAGGTPTPTPATAYFPSTSTKEDILYVESDSIDKKNNQHLMCYVTRPGTSLEGYDTEGLGALMEQFHPEYSFTNEEVLEAYRLSSIRNEWCGDFDEELFLGFWSEILAGTNSWGPVTYTAYINAYKQ